MGNTTYTGEVLLAGISGSTSHGLATDLSDIDIHGIFAAPTLEIAGLDWHTSKETYTTASPVGDDETYHEVAKAMHQFFKASPILLELLWIDEHTVKTEFGQRLIDIRMSFISAKRVVDSFSGLARSCIEKYTKSGRYKDARHGLRTIHTGVEFYTTGNLRVRVEDPAPYLALQGMPSGEVLDLLTQEYRKFDELETTALPTSSEKEPARALLRDIRKAYV